MYPRPLARTQLREERAFKLPNQGQRVLNFFLIERRVAGVGGGIENALCAGKNLVDEFDLAQALNVLRRNQLT